MHTALHPSSEVLEYAEKVFRLDGIFNQDADRFNHGDDQIDRGKW